MPLSRAKIGEIFRIWQDANPHPETELEYNSPYELLVAVTLSAQATDVGVNKATRKLFPVANTPQQIWDLGVEGLTRYIRTIGLFNAKAKNVIAAARILLDEHDGEVPREREAQIGRALGRERVVWDEGDEGGGGGFRTDKV